MNYNTANSGIILFHEIRYFRMQEFSIAFQIQSWGNWIFYTNLHHVSLLDVLFLLSTSSLQSLHPWIKDNYYQIMLTILGHVEKLKGAGRPLLLKQWPWTSNINITWELAKNFQALINDTTSQPQLLLDSPASWSIILSSTQRNWINWSGWGPGINWFFFQHPTWFWHVIWVKKRSFRRKVWAVNFRLILEFLLPWFSTGSKGNPGFRKASHFLLRPDN